ncbi:pyrroline-5-carboxylate reductase [Lacticigenium naphthae]|uniref:pyrroline-5-carboxylate reductase n=1 Tax=Lacticigenium naphthae TaxID=515351 RepID=UPI0004230DAA|nr:pyrroline-5-carboxylate reductase [Lacticigenium naphthae]
MKKLGFIGCGNMGEAMLAGIVTQNTIDPKDIVVSTRTEESGNRLKQIYGISLAKSNQEVAENSEMIFLATKPMSYPTISTEIKELDLTDKVFISVTPNYTLPQLRELFGSPAYVVRTMPNTPSQVGLGVTGIAFPDEFPLDKKERILGLFDSFGVAIEVEDKWMAAVGSLAGSAPAFIYMLIEAMAEEGMHLGMPSHLAYKTAALAVKGSAEMVLQSDKHVAQLRDEVSSPGGTTIEGIIALEKSGFKGVWIDALGQTAKKFRELEEKEK